MSQLNFWSITTVNGVKCLLPDDIKKFLKRQENVCFRSDHYQTVKEL